METREIKFKAWDKKAKKMIDLKAITPLACEPGLLEHGDGLFIPFRDDIILLQYTGLKDRNGKEVYEDDVLKDDNGDSFKVTWCHHGWYAQYFGDDFIADTASEFLDKWFHERGKVIGNIYENPELLKQ